MSTLVYENVSYCHVSVYNQTGKQVFEDFI